MTDIECYTLVNMNSFIPTEHLLDNMVNSRLSGGDL